MASGNMPVHIMAGDGDADTSAGCLVRVCGPEKLLDNVEAHGSTESVDCVSSAKIDRTPKDAVIAVNGQSQLIIGQSAGALNGRLPKSCAVDLAMSERATQQALVATAVKDQACHAAQGLLQLSSNPKLSSGHLVSKGFGTGTVSRQLGVNKSSAAAPNSVSHEPGNGGVSVLMTLADLSSMDPSKSESVFTLSTNTAGNNLNHFSLAASSSNANLVAMRPDANLFAQSNNFGSKNGVNGQNVERREPVRIGLKASESDLEKLRCSLCGQQSFYHQQHQDHLRQTHGDIVRQCKCCSHVAPSEHLLATHYTELHPRNICVQCGLTSEHAYIIKRHMYRHSSEGCACDVCGKSYKDQYILKMHIKMVHTPADVLYECSECTKKFTRKAHLKRHQRIHSAEKPFKCPHCDYRGCERSDISKHILVHDEPHHCCDVCGKTFRHIKNMELHVKRHRGQRDYKCGVCEFYGYTFTDIRKHIERKHTEYKTSICDYCGQMFKSESAMKDHQRSAHSSEVDGYSGSIQADNVVSGFLTHNSDSALLTDDTTCALHEQPARHSSTSDGGCRNARETIACDEEACADHDIHREGARMICRC